MFKDILLAAMLLKLAATQCILQNHLPRTPIEAATSSILEAFTGRLAPQIPVPSTPIENIILCRNLAAQIEGRAMAKLRRNAVKRPVFGQIIGPLLDEIAMACKCPICQNSNSLFPNSAFIPNIAGAPANNPNFIYMNNLGTSQNVNFNPLQFSCY